MQTPDDQKEDDAVDWTRRRLLDEILLPVLLVSVDQGRQLTSVRAVSKRFNRIGFLVCKLTVNGHFGADH